MALNITTRYSTDENGFPSIDASQAIVSPSIDPRRSFVTRENLNQVQTRLNFEFYSEDIGAFNSYLMIGNNEGNF
ncbi:MAG: hypothetical protein AAF383_03420 [Cyanobacteria bacterium P01_A01_bin.83]